MRFSERASHAKNPMAKKLFALMDEKKSNLAVAADVTSKEDLLRLSDAIGPEICVLKTHIDIIHDYDHWLTDELVRLAKKHRFLIFEDRKFADIGNTVKHQYKDGIYKISAWSDIINAHCLPGPGIIEGLKEVGLKIGKGLLLLAEMSSKGNLLHPDYTRASVEMAALHDDFVMGFISQGKLAGNPGFIHMTPGVNKTQSGDSLGQQYNCPEYVIKEKGSDIIIVGRGICEAKNPAAEAASYRKLAREAHLERIEVATV